MFVRVKQQLAASPASGGNYFVTVWLQVQAPTGIAPLTSHTWTYLPTLAVGKGWGDFDIQATVAAVLPDSNVAVLGDQIQTNVALPISSPEDLLARIRGELDVLGRRSARGLESGVSHAWPCDRPFQALQRHRIHDGRRLSGRGFTALSCQSDDARIQQRLDLHYAI